MHETPSRCKHAWSGRPAGDTCSPTARVGERILFYTALRGACSPSASARQPTSARRCSEELEVASMRAVANSPAVPLLVSDEGGHAARRAHGGRTWAWAEATSSASAKSARPRVRPRVRLSPIGSGRGSRKPGTGASVARGHGAAHRCAAGIARVNGPVGPQTPGITRAHMERRSRVRARARIRAREDEAFSPASAFSGRVVELGAFRGELRDGVHREDVDRTGGCSTVRRRCSSDGYPYRRPFQRSSNRPHAWVPRNTCPSKTSEGVPAAASVSGCGAGRGRVRRARPVAASRWGRNSTWSRRGSAGIEAVRP